jgi:MoaA/NifB/PqqE/SkfB family radical SAM enzyme
MNTENIDKSVSFTSANALPVKIFKDKELMDGIESKIIPVHLQVVPTNRCNLKCTFCSFDSRNKNTEIPIDDLYGIVRMAKDVGTKALSITGGGEPLLHPQINEFLQYAHNYDLKLGLVSNGKDLGKLKPENINLLTWYRISFDTNRVIDDKFINSLDKIVEANHSCDLAFSYILAGKGTDDWKDLKTLVNYVNDNDFSHIRIVEDQFTPNIVSIQEMKDVLKDYDTSKVVFQIQKEHTRGTKDCLISLLKPFIAADGYVYPCCGITYAINSEQRVEPKGMRMGHWTELPEIISKQKNFNGSICDKCYYTEYNTVLKALQTDLKHKEFI